MATKPRIMSDAQENALHHMEHYGTIVLRKSKTGKTSCRHASAITLDVLHKAGYAIFTVHDRPRGVLEYRYEITLAGRKALNIE